MEVRRNWLAFGGGLLVLAVFVIAIFAPLIAPYDPSKIDIKNILVGPSSQHLSAPTNWAATCCRA